MFGGGGLERLKMGGWGEENGAGRGERRHKSLQISPNFFPMYLRKITCLESSDSVSRAE